MLSGTKTLIIGMGEIGNALHNVLARQYITIGIDKEGNTTIQPDIMHICFPYSDNFVEYVKQYIDKYRPDVTVIHSTVPVGTTLACGENVFHSPVKGKHPNLEESLKKFKKPIGGDDKILGMDLAVYFINANIPAYWSGYSAKNTEFAKIMSTTRYGWEIIFCKGMKDLCDQRGLEFDFCYSQWNEDYNDGYREMNDYKFTRSLLKPVTGKIGGHCVIQNCELDDNEFTKLIKTFNESYD